MKKAFLPLTLFTLLAVGLVYTYPKLNHSQTVAAPFFHDKPVACASCGALMWDGPEAHQCVNSSSLCGAKRIF